MNELGNKLTVILADTYALYLKTQNYHWHVTGAQFKSLHDLFEAEYLALAEAIDDIAERIRTLGFKAPATFKEFDQLKTIADGDSRLSANEMVVDLGNDHDVLVNDLNNTIVIAQDNKDEGTVAILSERIAAHEKSRWMLRATSDNV